MDSSQQRKLLVAKRKRNGREREASRQIQLEGSTNKFSLEESPKKFKVDERVETPTCSTPRTLPQSRTNLNLSLRLKRIRESTGIPEEPRKIKKARMVLSQKQINTESFKWFNESIDNNLSSVNNNLSINYNNVFVVVDTNVFIDKLKIIINILQITYKDGTFPVIYVPWMVIQELDYFKEGYSTSSRHPISSQIQDRAKKAVKFINQMLLSRKPNFKGQSVREATDHLINTSNPDDAILSCCIQVAKCNDVILLSSDVNLRNKAIISDITSVPPEDIVRKLLDKKSVKSSVNYKQIILDKMSFICSYIMHIELKQFLGPQVYKLKNFQDPPWPYLECINYMKIYYMSILQNRVQKQCFKIITDLYATLKSNEEGNGQTLMELSLSLLVYLKVGLHKYSQNIQKVINELKTLDV